jgi:hypothetical protein
MTGIVVTTLIVAGLPAVVSIALLGYVVTAIHREERHPNLTAQPRTRAEIIARKALGVRIGQPEAFGAIAARAQTMLHHGAIPPGHGGTGRGSCR